MSVVGMGMSGTVYKARDLKLDRIVALKVLRKRDSETDVFQRFKREAELVARYPHAAIVPILDANLNHDPPFMVFRWMEGGDLNDLLEDGAVPVLRIALMGARLAGALAYLHGQGILHRDVKVGNVLLDEAGEAYLADLGLGRTEDHRSITQTGHVVGTWAYMAPEIFETGQYSPATDLFALGGLLLELAQGHRLFAPAAQTEATQKALKEVADKDLRKILRRCLRTEPSARPESAEELARELELLAAARTSGLGGPPLGGPPVRPSQDRRAVPDGSFSSEIARALLVQSTGIRREDEARATSTPTRPSRRQVTAAACAGLGLALGVGLAVRAAAAGAAPEERWPARLELEGLDWRRAPLLERDPGGEFQVEAESQGAAAVVLTGRSRTRAARARFRHVHRAPPGGLVGLLAWGGDAAGVVAVFETRAGPEATAERLALLWDGSGKRVASRTGGPDPAALRPLALTPDRLYLFLDGRHVAVLQRTDGVVEEILRLDWSPDLEVARLPDGLGVRDGAGRAWRFP